MPFLLENLKQENYLDNLHVTICNVGSRKLTHEQDDYISPGMKKLIIILNLKIIKKD